MNIFILDSNPTQAARFHCDKHVVKMILETAQLLGNAHHHLDPKAEYLSQLYKPTHINHPCSIWVRKNKSNYSWTYELWSELLVEYEKRYLKIHAASRLDSYLFQIPLGMRFAPRSEFAQALPKSLQSFDPVKSYRDYYCIHKAKMAKWNNRTPVPNWFVDRSSEAPNFPFDSP
jgi:Pyrimidine dimer DNA glycosylase